MKALWKKTKQRYMSRRGSTVDQNNGQYFESGPKWTVGRGESGRSRENERFIQKWMVLSQTDRWFEPKWTFQDDKRRFFEPSLKTVQFQSREPSTSSPWECSDSLLWIIQSFLFGPSTFWFKDRPFSQTSHFQSFDFLTPWTVHFDWTQFLALIRAHRTTRDLGDLIMGSLRR